MKVAGGFGQTAGHGPLSSKFGLTADLIVELKVVTADGDLKVVNERANQDLFWALRGGGGGTFGVVIEATMKAFPTPKVTLTRWWIKTADANNTDAIFPTCKNFPHSCNNSRTDLSSGIHLKQNACVECKRCPRVFLHISNLNVGHDDDLRL